MFQQLQTSGGAVPATMTLGGSLNVRGIGQHLRASVAHVVCRLHGHDPFIWRGGGRIALRCGLCGTQSRGWRLDSPPPVQKFAGDPARHALVGRCAQ